MDASALALFGVVVAVLVWRAVLRERREYDRFKRLRSSPARQKVYRRWVIEAFAVLGGLAAATILGAWPQIPTVLHGAQEWPPIQGAREIWLGGFGPVIGIGVGVLLLAVLIAPLLAARTTIDEVPAVGDIRAILPRTRSELPYGAALSVNAGVVEELLFRLGLPALLFAVVGDALIAFAGATVLFGLLHAYQGVLGVLFSTLFGALMVFLYLMTGLIAVPIVLHALFDLRSLVLIPLAFGAARAP